MKSFHLSGKEYIELNKLLKITGSVDSGGVAKMMINDGLVLVNGEIELRIRRKLRVNDVVGYKNQNIKIEQ
ncbi:MAG: RNA-binding S4 domain-containing protein [Flavobacteriales bacterium]|nr:RNA-binding S4 domain-containing protein [Flavobacteriales bacterium]